MNGPDDRPLWLVRMLGQLRAEGAGRVVERLATRKVAALLAYLAYHLDRPHPRELLIELLWPESDADAGRKSLSVALTALRRELEPEGVPRGSVLIADRFAVRLEARRVGTDVRDFLSRLAAARRAPDGQRREEQLAEATELYSGPLLPGYYDEWVTREQERLASMAYQALCELSELCQSRRGYEAALAWARRAVEVDPLREEARQRLMALYASAGEPGAALRQYEELAELLARELGARPSPETCALAERLRLGSARGEAGRAVGRAPTDQVSAVGARTRPGSPAQRLPEPLTPLFGREREIAEVAGILGPDPTGSGRTTRAESDGPRRRQRLVTLSGTGGIGKTRVAIAAAQQLSEAYASAVYFASLASLTAAAAMPGALAVALGVPPSGTGDPLDPLFELLSAKPSLLVLDNLEQLLPEGAALVRTLLQRCPALRILVTSRRRLDLCGERVLLLSTLPIPSLGTGTREGTQRTLNRSALEALPSVQLFVDRAQGVRGDFALGEETTEAVAALCSRLDGLPLAIELAAARAHVLTPAQMLVQLDNALEFLAANLHDPDLHHSGLRAALDWSYRLLLPAQQRLFARLSVFRGGWTLEAAEVICGDCGTWEVNGEKGVPTAFDPGVAHPTDPQSGYLPVARPGPAARAPRPPAAGVSRIPHSEVLADLAALVDASLVVAEEADGEMRYRLLEMLRAYAMEQVAPAERNPLPRRHLTWQLAVAEAAEAHLTGAEQAAWLRRLEREHDNLRAALDWCLGEESGKPRDVESALRLAGAIWRFWEIRGYVTEGRERLAAALRHADSTLAAPVRAKALNGAGVLALRQADYASACSSFEQSLALWRAVGNEQRVAFALNNLGLVALQQRDFPKARAFHEESLALKRRFGDEWGITTSLNNLGLVAQGEEDYATARALYEESLVIKRRRGDTWGIAAGLQNLGNVALHQEDLEAAQRFYEESLRLRRQLGDRTGVGSALFQLGTLAEKRNDLETARAMHAETLAIRGELGDRRGIAESLEWFALSAVSEGRTDAGLRLFSAAQALREAIGVPCPADERATFEAKLAAKLPPGDRCATIPIRDRFAWSEGRAMTVRDAVDEALRQRGDS